MGCSSTPLSLVNAGLDGLGLASLISVSLTVGTIVGFGINRVRQSLTGPTRQLPPVASKYANAAAAAVLPERVVSSS